MGDSGLMYVQWSCNDCSVLGAARDKTGAQAHADERDHYVVVHVTTVELLTRQPQRVKLEQP